MPTTTQRFILLPPRGLTAGEVGQTSPAAAGFLMALETVRYSALAAQPQALMTEKITTPMRVLDSIHENGAKLVEMSPEAVSDLRAEQPGLRVLPVVYYRTARVHPPTLLSAPKAAAGPAAALGLTLKVVSRADQTPLAGVKVIAFTNFAQRTGAGGVTNKKGEATLALGTASKKIERLYLYSASGFWNGLRRNLTLKNGAVLDLAPLDLGFQDGLRHFYGNSAATEGQGVTVGVIDTGVAAHPDLVINGGANTVEGENENDFGDNGEGHGTHVAGIIAARGAPPAGIRGLAPAVTLRAYRVFPKKVGNEESRAENFAIAKAIDRAVADGCDLINMSLGGGPKDDLTHSAIADARAKGTLVLIATGNDDRSPVSFPAADSLALAVSAMGRKGTFPADSTEVGDTAAPFGTDPANFIAAFSNVGSEVDLTAPGVGIISTYPGPAYAVLDGTSMACPAAVGAAARLLAKTPTVLAMARDQTRSDEMAKLVLQAARKLGFGVTFEGQGML